MAVEVGLGNRPFTEDSYTVVTEGTDRPTLPHGDGWAG